MSPSDKEVIDRLHNSYVSYRQRAADSSVKDKLSDDIFDAGIRMRNDTEYHPILVNNYNYFYLNSILSY